MLGRKFYEQNLENHEEIVETLTDLLIKIDAEYTHRPVDVTFSVNEYDGKFFGKVGYIVEGSGYVWEPIIRLYSHTDESGTTPEDCGAESQEEFVDLLNEMRPDYEDKALQILDDVAWEIEDLLETAEL